jgi:hypothetical protein
MSLHPILLLSSVGKDIPADGKSEPIALCMCLYLGICLIYSSTSNAALQILFWGIRDQKMGTT